MSRNIAQVYVTNPSTTLSNNDLLYSGLSPYGVTNDSAIKYSDLFTQVQTNIGTSDITMFNGKAIRTSTTTAQTMLFQAYDVDNTTYRTFQTFTNGNTPSMAIAAPSGGTITIDGSVIGGTTKAAGSFTTLIGGNITISAATSTITASDAIMTLASNSNIFSLANGNNAARLRFYNNIGNNYIGLGAGSLSADTTFILPTADAAGVMVSDGSANLSLTASPSLSTVTLTGAALTQKDYTANSSTAITIDPANGHSQGITLNSATPVLTLASNPSSGTEKEIILDVIQDGSGGRIPSWVNVTWDAGVAPAINQGADAVTRLSFKGTVRGWIGFAASSSTQSLYDPGFLHGLELVPINDTTFTISAGYCIDTTNALNLVLGSTTINFATTGANGLDTGSIGANKDYCVYLIGDSNGVNPTAGIVSLGTSGPTVMPSGYNKYRFIGNVFSDGASQLYDWVCRGKANVKEYRVDFAVDKVILSSGSSTTQTSIGTLGSFIPNTGFVSKIKFQSEFVPGIATDYARITVGGFVASTQIASVILGSGVNTAHFQCPFEIEPSAVSYQIDYLVDNALDDLTLVITGFTLSL